MQSSRIRVLDTSTDELEQRAIDEEKARLQQEGYHIRCVTQPQTELFYVVYRPQEIEDTIRHIREEPDTELGGVLVGEAYQNPDGFPWIIIRHIIPARGTDSTRHAINFNQDVWLQMTRDVPGQFPGEKIIGWYHSHPGHGIFLSEPDLFIHRNFFKERWQVALVLDPHREQGGFFTWMSDTQVLPPHLCEIFTFDEICGTPGNRRGANSGQTQRVSVPRIAVDTHTPQVRVNPSGNQTPSLTPTPQSAKNFIFQNRVRYILAAILVVIIGVIIFMKNPLKGSDELDTIPQITGQSEKTSSGIQIRVKGSGFYPKEEIEIRRGPSTYTGRADDEGNFVDGPYDINTDDFRDGTVKVIAIGARSKKSASCTFTYPKPSEQPDQPRQVIKVDSVKVKQKKDDRSEELLQSQRDFHTGDVFLVIVHLEKDSIRLVDQELSFRIGNIEKELRDDGAEGDQRRDNIWTVQHKVEPTDQATPQSVKVYHGDREVGESDVKLSINPQ